MSDPILPSVAAGDSAAVALCLDRYGGLVWSLARNFLRDVSETEDAVQEIFVELWKHAARFDPKVASEATFVSMLARRRLIDRIRKKSRRPAGLPLVEEPVSEAAGAEREVEIRDEAEQAARMLENLRPQQRKALELSIYHGLTHEQISEAMSLPLGTVKTHVRRGLQRLRELLGVRTPGTAGGGST